jgi:HSP20 family protein
MLSRWNDGRNEFDDMFATLDSLRQDMNRLFGDALGRGRAGGPGSTVWPRTNLIDAGSSLILAAEVPGLSDKDVEVTLNQDVLSMTGERKVTAPEGYSAHRQERAPIKFARSFALPSKVNPERVSATVKDGVLIVKLEKATEALPRQVKVNAA